MERVKKMQIDTSVKTCAVVGNAPAILWDVCGAEIDDHDIVIRCNCGTVKGYEHHVGTRTDFRLVNVHVFSFFQKTGINPSEEHLRDLDPANILQDNETLILKDFKTEGIKEQPRYKANIKRLWGINCEAYLYPEEALTNLSIWRHVSSGAYACAFARYMFPNAKINAYGFSFYEGEKSESHYFEKLENKTIAHNFKREKLEIEKIPNLEIKTLTPPDYGSTIEKSFGP